MDVSFEWAKKLKKSDKRKLVIALRIVGFLLLSSICYYLLYSYIQNKGTTSLCQNTICIPIISLAEFLSISTAVLGLFWVIDSLNAWKDQDAYYNSKDIDLELRELIYNCEIRAIIKIMDLPNTLTFDEISSNIKSILPAIGIGSPISNLRHKIEYENIYYREEFKELSRLVDKIISSMWKTIEHERNDFKNIDSRISIATRNDLDCAKKLSNKLQDKLYGLIDK